MRKASATVRMPGACLNALLLTMLAALCAVPSQSADVSWQAAYDAGQKAVKGRRYGDAEKHFLAAVKQVDKSGANDPRLQKSLGSLAELYQLEGKFKEAAEAYKRLLAIQEKTSGPNSREVGVTLHELAMVLCYDGKDAEAKPLLKRALAINNQLSLPLCPYCKSNEPTIEESEQAAAKRGVKISAGGPPCRHFYCTTCKKSYKYLAI